MANEDTNSGAVIIAEKTTAAELASAVRHIITGGVAYAVGKGLIPPDMAASAVTIAIIAANLLWSNISVRLARAELVHLGKKVDDSIAQVR